jgi:4-amino-4-deoxy-L-arabinose transferase-like glycosyltransferase
VGAIARRDWLIAWALFALIAIFLHGPLPLFSTRTLGVAWEMWQRGDFWLPVQNGLPYSHKPPTLYWLIHLGWALFGVNDVWPRVLIVGLGASAGALTQALGARLFPESPLSRQLAPWILLSSAYWVLFAQQIMFELLLVNAVLITWLGALRMIARARGGAALVAAGIGLGLLSKGPVMFLHVLPGLLLLPWVWPTPKNFRWRVLGLTLIGSAIALAWAVPVGMSVGPAFAEKLLLEQTTGRMREAFDHARPLWWYLPWLLVLGFPWISQWASARALHAVRTEASLKLLAVWVIPAFVGFCLVSGKQVYYLLPLLPAVALALGHGLAHVESRARPWLFVLLLGLIAAALLGFGLGWIDGGTSREWHAPLQALAPWAALAVALIATVALLPARSVLARVRLTAFASFALLLTLKALFALAVWPSFDLTPTARALAGLEARSAPVASIEYYEGQFHFAGRLTSPLQQLSRDPATVQAWVAQHPLGYLLVYPSRPTACAIRPLHEQPFRNQRVELWAVADWRRCGAPFG